MSLRQEMLLKLMKSSYRQVTMITHQYNLWIQDQSNIQVANQEKSYCCFIYYYFFKDLEVTAQMNISEVLSTTGTCLS